MQVRPIYRISVFRCLMVVGLLMFAVAARAKGAFLTDTLYVIDGEVSPKRMKDIDPKEVLQLEILKQAESSRLYNVDKVTILITTIKFAKGFYRAKFSRISNDYKELIATQGDEMLSYIINGKSVTMDVFGKKSSISNSEYERERALALYNAAHGNIKNIKVFYSKPGSYFANWVVDISAKTK